MQGKANQTHTCQTWLYEKETSGTQRGELGVSMETVRGLRRPVSVPREVIWRRAAGGVETLSSVTSSAVAVHVFPEKINKLRT